MSTIKTNQIQHTANGAAAFTLPTSDGSSGQFLKTNASGALSFGSGGKILQYKYKEVSGTTYSTTSSTFQNISDFDLTVTPTSATSILIIQVNLRIALWHSTGNGGNMTVRISDDNASTYLSDGLVYIYRYDTGGTYWEGTDTQVTSVVAGSTNARTYKLYYKQNDGQMARINQNNSTNIMDRSSIQVMEVAA
jgi:hypothetical protein